MVRRFMRREQLVFANIVSSYVVSEYRISVEFMSFFDVAQRQSTYVQ